MDLKKRPLKLIVAALSLLLLGLIRGGGGLSLLIRGKGIFPDIQASESEITLVGILLCVVGLVLIISAMGFFIEKKKFWVMGIISVVLFVIDGLFNGYMLFGRPNPIGTAGNIVVAAFIILMILRAKS